MQAKHVGFAGAARPAPSVSNAFLPTAIIEDDDDDDSSVDESESPYTITEETLRERVRKRSTGRKWPQVYAAIMASLGSFSFGSSLGWSSPALDRIVASGHMKEMSMQYFFAWIVSLVPLGIAIGMCAWTYVNAKYGPRKTMLVQSPFSLVAWILLGIDHRSYRSYMFARLCCGFFSASYVISGESLLVESTHRVNVPKMIIGYRCCILGGVLYSYVFNGYLKQLMTRTWQFGVVNPAVIVVHIVMLCCCPESPVHLYNRNEQKATAALVWYKGDANLNEELRIIRRDAELKKVDPDAHKYMFLARAVKKALCVVLGLFFCQVFSGYYAFMFVYAAVWHNYTRYWISQHADPIFFGIVMLGSNTASSIAHYRGSFGVRRPLLVSGSVMFVAHVTAFVYMLLYIYGVVTETALARFVPLVVTCFYAFGYEIGLSHCPDILLADYMPHQVYLRARMICKTVNWLLVFVYIHVFTLISQLQYGMVYNVAVMACVTFCGVVFVYAFVVETQNKTLIAIQIELGGNPIGNRGGSRQRSLGVDRRLSAA